MPTLKEQLQAALAKEQQELARITADAEAKTAKSNTKIAALQAADAALTPEVIALIEQLAAAGITMSFS